MASVRAAVMVVTLLTVCLLAMNASAARYECCRTYMKTRISFKAIRGYSVQTSDRCPLRAIIFHVKKGKACVNPALDWVRDYINKLRKKVQMLSSQTPETELLNSFPKTNDSSSIPDVPSVQQPRCFF